MAKFKLGDRVRVGVESDGRFCRGPITSGRTGIIKIEDTDPYVLLDGDDGDSFWYLDEELELIND